MNMNQSDLIERTTSISDLLRDYPQAIPVFLKHHMACVGCSMSAFETIESAACIYGIAPETLLDEVRSAVGGLV
ncbi:MAG TPA: DUF1858 domain-containing protein [Anaerolineaceae bacterium]